MRKITRRAVSSPPTITHWTSRITLVRRSYTICWDGSLKLLALSLKKCSHEGIATNGVCLTQIQVIRKRHRSHGIVESCTPSLLTTRSYSLIWIVRRSSWKKYVRDLQRINNLKAKLKSCSILIDIILSRSKRLRKSFQPQPHHLQKTSKPKSRLCKYTKKTGHICKKQTRTRSTSTVSAAKWAQTELSQCLATTASTSFKVLR
jgi:hypothetical protein